jgi:hypothetical protein
LQTPLPAGPTAGGDGSLVGVAVPVGAIGALMLVAFLLARGRWRPVAARSGVSAAASGGGAAGGRAGGSRRANDEPDALSALNDPVAPFLEPVTAAAAAPESVAPVAPAPIGTPSHASDQPATPPAPADPWSRARTISMHVEHIEADDA